MVDGKAVTSLTMLCLLPSVLCTLSQMCLVGVQISGVVGEQELGLRQMLRTMGMLDSAYWLSWMLFEVTPPLLSEEAPPLSV